MKTYTAKCGATQYKPSLEEIEQMLGDQEGFCLACGEHQSDVEPDARRYRCEACGKPKVYGAEELALMGLAYAEEEKS